MTRPIHAVLAASLGLAACAAPPPAVRGSYAAARPSSAELAGCRSRADEVYLKQNRVELSLRDQRDTPFASTGLSGITSQGLGARFGHDQMVADCLRSVGTSGAGATDTTPGPAMSPAAPADQGVGPVR